MELEEINRSTKDVHQLTFKQINDIITNQFQEKLTSTLNQTEKDEFIQIIQDIIDVPQKIEQIMKLLVD